MEEEAARLRAQILALERRQAELTTLLGEFDHELRRCRDALERAGGRSREVEEKMRNMNDGLERSRAKLASTTVELDDFRRKLRALMGERG